MLIMESYRNLTYTSRGSSKTALSSKTWYLVFPLPKNEVHLFLCTQKLLSRIRCLVWGDFFYG